VRGRILATLLEAGVTTSNELRSCSMIARRCDGWEARTSGGAGGALTSASWRPGYTQGLTILLQR
jgi:hypothetical protein